MDGRSLTDGEISLAKSIYGNSIDYADVQVFNRAYAPMMRVSAPDGNIYYSERYSKRFGLYSEDISELGGLARGTLIHELYHVYQHQSGVAVMLDRMGDTFGHALSKRGAQYDFSDKISKRISFENWTIEEQASFFEEIYYRANGLPSRFPDLTVEALLGVVGTDFNIKSIMTPKCFASGTPIRTDVGAIEIQKLALGDLVTSFDPFDRFGRGALLPRRIVRLYQNFTTEWIKLTWVEAGESRQLVTTPGHHFLDHFGQYPTIESMVKAGRATVVLASGELAEVSAERIVYSDKTAHMFERAVAHSAVAGSAALQPVELDAWATYNFEVEDLHTYVAGGRCQRNAPVVPSCARLAWRLDKTPSLLDLCQAGRHDRP